MGRATPSPGERGLGACTTLSIMKSRLAAFAFVVAAVVPFVSGCAAEEEESRVAYPEPVGYTTPPAQVADSQLAPSQPPVDGQQDPNGGDVTVGEQGDADQYADTDPSALSDFHATLDPYGTWQDDATYGSVWVPSASVVGDDFTPYVSAGHWTYDDDYVWNSDYDWGWAPFHYGRWAWGTGIGWEWIPGRVYSGAWVSWRYGWDDWGYVGWGPLAPSWCWRGGVAVGLGFVPRSSYGYVSNGELFSPHVGTRLVTGTQAGVVASHTRPYVPATPGVGGRGPSPQSLHLPATAIAHASPTDRGLMQARAYSRGSSAVALGAHAPQGALARGGVTAPSYGRSVVGSRYGGSVAGGSGYARTTPYSGSRPYTGGVGTSRPYTGSRPYSGGVGSTRPYAGGSTGFRGGYSAPSGSRPPAFRGFGGGSGGYHPPSGGFHGPAPSSGYRGFSGGGGGGFHGGGGGFHGGGGGFGGGFHGGGGGGGHGGRR
jgi:hypothetical protein